LDNFVGRQRDLAELNTVLSQRGAQFILVYGRRRVGKTTLILQWARQTSKPVIYWVATRDTPAQIRQSFTRALWSWAYPDSRAIPQFGAWAEIFETAANLIADQPVILIMDEFSYAVESDPALPSNLQVAWDHLFKDRNATLVLAGSHIGMMVELMGYQAPLYGRFTAQLPVDPLPFATLQAFLPRYSVAERVAVYAVAGGIPAYLERFNDAESLGANIQRLFMRRASMFRSEPFILIGDVIRRETHTYEAILKAIAGGQRTPNEIGTALGKPSSYLSPYLKQLERLRLIERRLSATIPPEHRRTSRIVGGLVGRTNQIPEWLEVSIIWVAEDKRRQGVGRRLMHLAEAEAIKRSCRYARLATSDYQAPDFYRKVGYKLYGQLENCPRGETVYYFYKEL
jgi:hypothetical protein